MCQNYEAGLQKAQQKVKELEKASELAERNLQRAKDDLAREHDFRQEMEAKWNEKKDQHKVQVVQYYFLNVYVLVGSFAPKQSNSTALSNIEFFFNQLVIFRWWNSRRR